MFNTPIPLGDQMACNFTKREYFSAVAMQGLLNMAPQGAQASVICKEAVQLADLLLAELAKEKK